MTFTPGEIYAKLHDGVLLKFVADDNGSGGTFAPRTKNKTSWSPYTVRHDYGAFSATPVEELGNHKYKVGDQFQQEFDDGARTTRVLATLRGGLYLVAVHHGRSNTREEVTEAQLQQLPVSLNPASNPAPATPLPETVGAHDRAPANNPYPESPERVAEVEAILKEHGIAFITVEQVNHTDFYFKLPQAEWPLNLHHLTHRAGFTPYRTEYGKVWAHRYTAPAVTPSTLDAAVDAVIDDLRATIATRDKQIAALQEQQKRLQEQSATTRQIVLNGGVQGNRKQAFVRQDVSESEYTQLLNDGRVTITATQFIIHPVTGAPMFCVAGYRRMADEQPAARIAASRPLGMTSLADALGGMMDAATRLSAEIHTGANHA